MAWDRNKGVFIYCAAGTLSVPGADEAAAGFVIHWYTGDHFDAVRLFHEKHTNKQIWFTEGCMEYSRLGGN